MNTTPVFGSNAVEQLGAERFRPQFHFSAHRNWINDPNGLVYFAGEYHLFFQYNPQGRDWGNMCWGHAVSADLLHWRELAIAIPETDRMIFSGSAVVDWHDLSGLGDGSPPLLAYFTAFDPSTEIQSQHLAYSHDRGRSFSHYAGNPILDLGAKDFRDPKVFYHDESKAWVMAAVLARSHVVQFYRSANLRDWALAGEFGGRGCVGGQWECPDLIRVGIDGSDDRARWVLKVDVDDGIVAGGSGAQYFVGDFDGFAFSLDAEQGNPAGDLVDCGPDFYAAVTWSDLPKSQPGPVWIGWQSNHQSGKSYPTHPWRGAMTLPRQLFLFAEAGQLRLGQRPIAAISGMRGAQTLRDLATLEQGAVMEWETPGKGFVWCLTLADQDSAQVSAALVDDLGELLTCKIEFSGRLVTFTRQPSPLCPSDQFARTTTTRLAGAASVELDIIVDESLVEIFVDGGRRVYSAVVFPQGPVRLSVSAHAGTVRIVRNAHWPIGRAIDFAN